MLTDILKTIVGDAGWLSDESSLEPHLTEWRGRLRGETPLMVSPSNTEQLASVVRACVEHETPIVPQGGNTGLCGGAIPDGSGEQILVSLSRMNRIRSISADNYSMVAEAGCVLADLQTAAADVDRLFPLSLAAEGSCQIGGNLSTDAGGTNVLRYGTARSQALGLEVVLADGSVWDGLRALRKDTAGYDVKQLFIGAEGTLGIITAACLRLYPLPAYTRTAMFTVESPRAAVRLLTELRSVLADQLQAFELISDRAMRYVQRHVSGSRNPFEQQHPWYVLLDSSFESDPVDFEKSLMSALESGLATDAVVAKSESEQSSLWRIRHSISEAQKQEGASLKHDVSVPISSTGEFIEQAEAAVLEAIPEARVVAFGHVGDGNVHFNVSQPRAWSSQRFMEQELAIEELIYDTVTKFAGSISAEHGIGQVKRAHLRRYRSAAELSIMQAVKQALDPHNLLNPGKVI